LAKLTKPFRPISLILPSITAVQCALFDLLCSFGLRPDVLIGHSAGETSLLYASGAGSKEMALEISIARGIAMTIVEERSEVRVFNSDALVADDM
jgi:acyl transferase domain-containing protein